jgi:hypothetical protein
MSDEEIEDMTSAVDDAFAMLLSLGESQQENAKVAVMTVHRMLTNLHTNPQDLKLRSIRLNNKAFQSKVGCIAGGIELIIAAGYEHRWDGGEMMSSGSTKATSSVGVYEDENSYITEGFLVHDMSSRGIRKLAYTLSR